MVTETVQAPHPLRLGPVLRRSDGKPIVIQDPRRGDWIDLSTGECHAARVLGGVRYDTDRADLVVRRSSAEYNYYRWKQVFRGHDDRWFVLSLIYDLEWGQCEGGALRLLARDEVLLTLREVLAGEDAWPLLRDWYLSGWLPRDDAFVQAWAEATLSADECELLIEGFAALPDEPSPDGSSLTSENPPCQHEEVPMRKPAS